MQWADIAVISLTLGKRQHMFLVFIFISLVVVPFSPDLVAYYR